MPYSCPDSPLSVHVFLQLGAVTDKELASKLEQGGLEGSAFIATSLMVSFPGGQCWGAPVPLEVTWAS